MSRDQLRGARGGRGLALATSAALVLAGCSASAEQVDQLEQALIAEVGPPAPGPAEGPESAAIGWVAKYEHPDLDYLELMDWYRGFVDRMGCDRYELRGVEVPARGRSERYFVKCHLERGGVDFVVTSETKLDSERGSTTVTAERNLGS